MVKATDNDIGCIGAIRSILWKSREEGHEDLYMWFCESRHSYITNGDGFVRIDPRDDSRIEAIAGIITRSEYDTVVKDRLLSWLASGVVVLQKIVVLND